MFGLSLDWEQVLGKNWLAIVGALALAIGVGMGGIYSVRRAEEVLAPAMVEAVTSARASGTDIDMALLVPV